MKKLTQLLLFSVVLISLSCSKNKKDDNLFQYRAYVSYVSTGTRSVSDPIIIELVKPLKQFKLNQEIPSKYLDISPETDGKLYVENGTTLRFVQSKNLESGTKYSVTLHLGELYDSIPQKLKKFTFSFNTIKPNFKVTVDYLQSYSKTLQYIQGTLQSADYINPKKLPKMLKATQNGKPLSIKWVDTVSHSKYFHFKIDSITRLADDSKILISWDGSAIGSDNKGQNYYAIPGYNNFKIVNINTKASPKFFMAINFSDPLDPDQNFAGLVKIEKMTDLKFEVNGNVLYVYPSKRINGELNVTVYPGIKSKWGATLKQEFSELVSFQQLKPAVKLISKGVILPSAQSTPIYFKAVNLSAIDIRVIKIYDDNVLQFLQSNELNSTSNYHIRRVGRLIAKKTIHLDVNPQNQGTWQAYGVKLSNLFKADPGALYRLEFSFKKSYSSYNCDESDTSSSNDRIQSDKQDTAAQNKREQEYWNNQIDEWRTPIYDWEHEDDPCYDAYYQEDHFTSTNILGSDLGLIVKKGADNSYKIFTTNLISAKPESGVKVKLYNFQQQVIAKLKTDKNGEADYQGQVPAAFVVAQSGNNYAYAKLDDGDALSMSKFDISGNQLQQGLKGFIYDERGVYRPGDTIHLTFVLDDKDNPLPKNVPVKLEVENAYGKLVQRTISTSGEKSKFTRSVNRFYYFPISTQSSDATGNWQAKISVGGAKFYKIIKVATIKPNRLKIKLDFADKILEANKAISGKLTGTWLQGAPARNLKAEINLTLTNASNPFKNYSNYIFTDPIREFDRTEIPFLTTNLSNDGTFQFNKKIAIDQKAPGMLNATFLTKLYEGGGDFSIDVFTMKLAPFSHFVGIQAPKPDEYGSYTTDVNNRFDVVSVDAQGRPSANRKLHVQIFKIEWRWWWDKGDDQLSEYQDASIHTPVKDFTIMTDANGKGHFDVNIPKIKEGRYLIRVKDEQSGHATGLITYFYRDWFNNTNGNHAENTSMLVFSSDKKQYNVGETAKITFPSGANGHALISIENGTKVLSTEWVETQKGKTTVEIPLTAQMSPNIYVDISLIQPHDQTKNNLPIRLYGVIPIKVVDPNTILKPQIQMPDVLHPNKNFTIKVSEKNDKAMTYTIAVVDEGLLDLTRFKTPDIHNAFYSREALGVKTFDIYNYVIGAYSGSVNNIYAVGGDGAAKSGKEHKANRFKPVVMFLGPFHLKAGQTQSHTIKMPNYIGAVRTMVVAGNDKEYAYGSTDKTTPVRQPLMVLASLPRKLSPGETVTVPVTVFAMKKSVKNVQVRMNATSALQPIGATEQTIHFDEPGQQIVNFKYKVKSSNAIQKIAVNVSGNGEKASYNVEFNVLNPNPMTGKLTNYQVEKNATQTITYQPYGVKGTNAVKLELSTLPPMDFTKRLQYLIHYPYGCVEQTTSSGFPQLFLSDIFDLTYQRKKKIEENVKATIKRLGDAQLTSGAMPFWPGGNEPSEWATTYAGHFMLEAQKKGYALPLSFLNNWLRYQKSQAREWNMYNYSYNTSLQQAYRLYTLALAGQPLLAAMNRLRVSKHLSNSAKWRLAAAYALAGKKDVAMQIEHTANIDFKPNKYDYYTYGSPFRNEAMALETMVILGNPQQRQIAISLAKKLSSDDWYSTQETSFALLAMAEMVEKNGGNGMDLTIVQNGKRTTVKTSRALAERALSASSTANTVKIINNKSNVVFLSLYQEGKLPLGQEMPQSRNLILNVQYLDGAGKALDVSKLRQGTEIEAKITIKNTSYSDIHNLALSQILPSGWEIINTSFTNLQGGVTGEANFTDIRDDRVNFYLDLDEGETKTFTVKLNASYLGRYYLPGTQAEGMYNHSYYARTKGQWVVVY